MIEFQDRIQKNPRLLRLKNPTTGEVIDWEIQDLEDDEIEQEGTLISAEVLNNMQKDIANLISIKSQEPIGEFVLWEGNYCNTENGNFYPLGVYYSTYSCIVEHFPLKEGFTRKYKLMMEYTNTDANTENAMYVQFADAATHESYKEYTFPNIWGGAEDGTRTCSESKEDFDIATLHDNGSIRIKITPAFGSGAQFRVYKIYLLVYDVLNEEV